MHTHTNRSKGLPRLPQRMRRAAAMRIKNPSAPDAGTFAKMQARTFSFIRIFIYVACMIYHTHIVSFTQVFVFDARDCCMTRALLRLPHENPTTSVVVNCRRQAAATAVSWTATAAREREKKRLCWPCVCVLNAAASAQICTRSRMHNLDTIESTFHFAARFVCECLRICCVFGLLSCRCRRQRCGATATNTQFTSKRTARDAGGRLDCVRCLRVMLSHIAVRSRRILRSSHHRRLMVAST